MNIARHVMSGRGPKVTWSIQVNGQELFKTDSGSYHAWSKKKHVQLIIDSIQEYGIDHTLNRIGLDRSRLVNLSLLD